MAIVRNCIVGLEQANLVIYDDTVKEALRVV